MEQVLSLKVVRNLKMIVEKYLDAMSRNSKRNDVNLRKMQAATLAKKM